MNNHNLYRYFESSPEITRLAVVVYIRFPRYPRNVEDLLHEHGIDIFLETIRYWWNKFGPMFAREIRKKRLHPIIQLEMTFRRGLRENKWECNVSNHPDRHSDY